MGVDQDSDRDSLPHRIVWTIVVPVVTAVLAAGSAPWWWNTVFPPPYMGQLLFDTNLQGSDVSNIDKAEVNTAGECSTACLRDDRCRAMTFVKHPASPGGVCWLKDTVPPKGSTLGYEMVSAIKVFPRIFGI